LFPHPLAGAPLASASLSCPEAPVLTLLVYLSPLLILIVVFGLVVIAALCQANPEDVPAVLTEATKVFRRLADRVSPS
jgi:hypothetical protein